VATRKNRKIIRLKNKLQIISKIEGGGNASATGRAFGINFGI
jgi:hypothetical protein